MERILLNNKTPYLITPLMYRGVVKERPSTFLYEEVQKRIEADRGSIEAFLNEVRPFCYHPKFEEIPLIATVPGELHRENGWFTRGDARSAYGIVAALRPKRIIEIGSGNSTMFMRRAINDFSLETKIISVDPAPREEVDAICDTVIRKSVLDVDLELFRQLEPGDILFHDGSHLTFNGTDTVRLFLEIWPIVAPGVLFHVHDICLPLEYTSSFDNRGYSEQYMLATALLYSRSLEVLLPVAYLSSDNLFDSGLSFWLQKRE